MQEPDRRDGGGTEEPGAGGRARWLLAPVEIYGREIDSRLLLALHAVRRGWRVVLGYLSDEAFRAAPPGALFYKSHNASARRYLRDWIAQGHACTALDEEGLIWVSPEVYVADRIDPEFCAGLARIFVWGEEQADLFPAGLRDRLVIAGHPKIDLVRLAPPPAPRAPGAPASILFNMRFSLLTGFVQVQRSLPEGFLDNERRILAMIEDAIRLLAREPGLRVRVRPHPSERAAYYAERFADLPSVAVETDRTLVEAFRDSDALVHDACTTAVEAAAYGLPVFGLRPAGLDGHYDTIGNRFSTANLRDPQALRDALRGIADGPGAGRRPPPPGATRSIANLTGPLACPAILDALEAVAPPAAPAPAAWSAARRALRLGGAGAVRLVRGLTRSGGGSVRDEKFPETLTAEALEARLRRLDAGLAEPLAPQGLRVAKLSKRGFLIEAG